MIPSDDLQDFYYLTPELMCIANMEGYFLDVNPSFSRILGYTETELKSRKFIELVHEEDIGITNEQMSHLAEGKIVQDFYNRYLHADGHYITLRWSAYANNDKNKIYAIASDITEQQKVQRKLDQIEKALQDETILVLTDKNGVITEVNQKFCEISGYQKHELMGKTHKLINSGFHPKEFFADLWQTISSGRIWTGTIKNKKKNGEFYYVKSIITPIFDSVGEIANYLAIRQDVTDTIQSATELNRVLEVLNETSTIARVGGWELDIATGELTWTDQTFKILEVEKTEGQKPILPEGLKLFIPEHQPIIENAVNRAIQFGEPYSLELTALTAKGNELWVYTNGKANYKDGEIVTLSGTIQDIDEQKKARLKYELEKQKSVHNAKLASLGELAASVAHEINNPLGIISGYTEILQVLLPSTTQVSPKLDAISKSVNRIAHIVRSLKKYSQTDTQKEHAKLRLHDIFEEAITLVGPKLKRYDVELITNIEKDCSVMGNEIELEQVFINLINNSLDAIKTNDTKWIKVEVAETDFAVKVAFVDSGTGIPESLQERIFEPFYTSKETGEGTGLGLSIVRGILMDHKAKIELDKHCENTRFDLSFPRIGVA